MRTTSKQLSGGKIVQSEKEMQAQICKYLKLAYPLILFKIDFGTGAVLSPIQARQQKGLQKVRGWPDLFICEPRGGFAGLFIELKKEGELIYNKRGLFATSHLQDQGEVLEALRSRGFKAEFAKGFEAARKMIDHYLSLK